jgi:ribosome-interacting GTPase 1
MTCSLILVILDSAKPWSIRQKIEKELHGFGMRINKQQPNITVVKNEKGEEKTGTGSGSMLEIAGELVNIAEDTVNFVIGQE